MNDQGGWLGLFDLNSQRAHCVHRVHAIVAGKKSAERANAVGKRGNYHRAMRNALITWDSDFEIDSRCPLYSQLHRMNLIFLMFMPDVRIERMCCPNPVFTITASASSGTARVTARGKSCRCKDLSLRCREEILPHRYICRANTGFPLDAVCREQGSRTDNLPLLPLSGAQPRAAAKMRPPVEVQLLAEPVHSG